MFTNKLSSLTSWALAAEPFESLLDGAKGGLKTRNDKINKGTICAIGLVFRQPVQAGTEEEHLCEFEHFSCFI